MFDDLDEALRELLKSGLPVKNGEVEIVFNQPRRDWSARLSKPTINLFLFDVREDLKRRATLPPWRTEPVSGGAANGGADGGANRNAVNRRRPLHLVLHYALTAWATEPEDEHRLLAATLLALYRYPQLPADVTPAALRGPTPISIEVAQAEGLMNPSDFWSAMDNEIRPLLFCTVALAVEPNMTETWPIVRKRGLRFVDATTGETEGPGRELWIVRGVVSGLPPLRPARLRVIERELDVEIDHQGQYVIAGIPAGAYTVEISAVGIAATRQALTVPAPDYDLQVVAFPAQFKGATESKQAPQPAATDEAAGHAAQTTKGRKPAAEKED